MATSSSNGRIDKPMRRTSVLVTMTLLLVTAIIVVNLFLFPEMRLRDAVCANDIDTIRNTPNDRIIRASLQRDTSLLFFARSKEMAELLIAKGCDVNQTNADGLSPLHVAAHLRHPEMVGLLLRRGAFADAKDHLGQTPLHWLVHDIQPPLTFGYLFPDSDGVSPISPHGTATAKLLVEAGADPKSHDNFGRSPLAEAEYCREMDIVTVFENWILGAPND